MKKLLTITFLLVIGQAFSQDFVKKSDGTFQIGSALSLESNVFKLITEEADTLVFKIEELAIIHISKEGFAMKNLQLQNAQFKSNQYGTTIIFPDNNLKSERKFVKRKKESIVQNNS
jgi:hypothetical protein